MFSYPPVSLAAAAALAAVFATGCDDFSWDPSASTTDPGPFVQLKQTTLRPDSPALGVPVRIVASDGRSLSVSIDGGAIWFGDGAATDAITFRCIELSDTSTHEFVAIVRPQEFEAVVLLQLYAASQCPVGEQPAASTVYTLSTTATNNNNNNNNGDAGAVDAQP